MYLAGSENSFLGICFTDALTGAYGGDRVLWIQTSNCYKDYYKDC